MELPDDTPTPILVLGTLSLGHNRVFVGAKEALPHRLVALSSRVSHDVRVAGLTDD
jgi:hypothetical protein